MKTPLPELNTSPKPVNRQHESHEQIHGASRASTANGSSRNLDQEIPRDLFRDRKLQSLAKKHGIAVDIITRFNGFGKEVVERRVVEKDYPRWCEVVRNHRAAHADKEQKRADDRVRPFCTAVADTPFASLLDGLPSDNENEFRKGFFVRLMGKLNLKAPDISFQHHDGKVQVSASHSVVAFGKETPLIGHLDLNLSELAKQLAHAKSPEKRALRWSNEILKNLSTIVSELQRSVRDLPGFDCLTADELHALIVRDGRLWSNDPTALRDRIAPAARNRAEENAAGVLASKHREFTDYLHCFPMARKAKRRIIAYLGPTNSGKTHHAIARLVNARSGVYLGPLRLLALEQQEAIERQGVPCSLITGEERVMRSMTHSSRTIEMANLQELLDVAVIDEFQMVHDPDRGWAWTQALCGIGASEIIITGSPAALPAIETLAKLCGDTLETRIFARNGTLEMSPIVTPDSLRKGSAVICFSRRMVIQVRELFQGRGIACSAIYGDLSPEVRREEARRFREGETDIVVATDAIGMGLNLPIEQVAFWETDKFDGETDRPLTIGEIHQIAGRAGRGLGAVGHVTAFSIRDHKHIAEALDKNVPPVAADTLNVTPTPFHLEKIASVLGENRLAILLAFFIERTRFDNQALRPAVSDQVRELARILDKTSLTSPVGTRFLWLRAPLGSDLPPSNQADEWLYNTFVEWYRSFCSGQPCRGPVIADKSEDISRLEVDYQALRLYRWLGQRFPQQFVDLEQANHTIQDLNGRIKERLQDKRGNRILRRKECIDCGRALSPDSEYSLCRPCYRRARYDYDLHG